MTTFASITLTKILALGVFLLSAYPWLSMALALALMVRDVWRNLKPTQFIILNNSCFKNFLKKSIPGDVRAQVLQEPVGASHADQGRKSGLLHPFPDPGGQDESTGTPHLTLPSKPSLSQGGGSCSNIYIDQGHLLEFLGCLGVVVDKKVFAPQGQIIPCFN